MEHTASISSLLIVIIAAFLTPLVLHRLKLNIIPVVVAEIIVGLIIGKSGFDIVQSDEWLEILSTLGFIFLMFLSGLEIDFNAFKIKKKNNNKGEQEPNPLVISIIIFTGILLLSYGLSYLFVLAGFIDSVMLMTIIISTISLGVVVPTLKEENLMKTMIGQIILLVAVIADLVTMILLAVFVSIKDSGSGNTWLLLILFAAGVLLYFVGRKFQKGQWLENLSKGTVQIGTRAVFTLIIFLVALSETVGAENILGAFLAGTLVSLLAPSKELVSKLDSFGYGFLIPVFFVMIGVELNIWALFSDPQLLLLIPLLLIALLISKILPVWILKKWYSTKMVVASSFILTATLSLVIAAATIGEDMGILSSELGGTLILVAVISSIITPAVFKKIFPKQDTDEIQIDVAIIGANQMTLPVYEQLKSSLYNPIIFHRKQEKLDQLISKDPVFSIVELEDYNVGQFEKYNIFAYDVVVLATGDEDLNASLAKLMVEKGVDRVLARVERPTLSKELKQQNVETFSSILAQHVLLRVAIESPSMLQLLTDRETSLYEIKIRNSKYNGVLIRKFPFMGDVIFVRILRDGEAIIPHGDTELRLDDRLIVSGSTEYLDELKMELELT